MTGAVFLGSSTSRNEDWLSLSIQYPIDTFQTAFQLRMFPKFTHPLLARLLPSRYRLKRSRQKAKSIITSLIAEYQEKSQAGFETEDTLLAWMLDNATGAEAEPTEMTSRQLVLTLASIHTTALALSHAFYDLCAHPEYVDSLREEIEEVTRKYQGADFIKHGLQRLVKLESFLVESQRFHPPVLSKYMHYRETQFDYSAKTPPVSPQRVAMQPIKLHDGTHIPKRTRVAFASAAILMDPAVTPDPDKFNGCRSYHKRQEPGEEHHHLWVQTDKEHLAFGHGKQACPGRHFAAAEIKVVLARIIKEYDIRYWRGQERPKTFFLDENIFQILQRSYCSGIGVKTSQ